MMLHSVRIWNRNESGNVIVFEQMSGNGKGDESGKVRVCEQMSGNEKRNESGKVRVCL